MPFFGLEFSALIPTDRDLGKQLQDIHVTISMIGYGG